MIVNNRDVVVAQERYADYRRAAQKDRLIRQATGSTSVRRLWQEWAQMFTQQMGDINNRGQSPRMAS